MGDSGSPDLIEVSVSVDRRLQTLPRSSSDASGDPSNRPRPLTILHHPLLVGGDLDQTTSPAVTRVNAATGSANVSAPLTWKCSASAFTPRQI
jgi:hypothetical protein